MLTFASAAAKPISWNDAQSTCEGQGGYLASIHESEIQETVELLDVSSIAEFWIGAREGSGNCNNTYCWYPWHDDRLVSNGHLNWGSDEPDATKGEVSMLASDFRWYAYQGLSEKMDGFLCQMPSDDCAQGSSESCPAESCQAILDEDPSQPDGTYWLDVASSGSFLAYCDMTTDGGGWTYVARGSNGSTQTDAAYGAIQNDPAAAVQWHLSMDEINAIVGGTTPYNSYVTMGENGDSDSSDAGQYRIRREYDAMSFSSAMYNYDAWDGSVWTAATKTGDSSHRGPSWVSDASNTCCERGSSGAWENCYLASSSLGDALWSQGNSNQHLRCSASTQVQNGLLLFVR